MALIELLDISKSFDGELVLDEFNLKIEENEFITLLGPSGCGKTTTLRILGGFEKPDTGKVLFQGEDITDLAPNKRHINTVFQKYALFPNMNIAENIAFGLNISRKSQEYINDKIKYAIARAIVNEPRVLLLDEPLGALDLKLRQEMQYELIRLKNELGITFLYVTHDQEEALTMSDKVVVMNQGYIQQMGTPEEIYNEPENAFVADFIGDSNIIDGIMLKDRVVKICGCVFPCIDEGFGNNTPVDVVIRPEDIVIDAPGKGIIDGVVTSNVFIGVHYEMCIEAGGFEWLAQNTVSYPVGTKVSMRVIPENIQIMNKPQSEDEEALALDE